MGVLIFILSLITAFLVGAGNGNGLAEKRNAHKAATWALMATMRYEDCILENGELKGRALVNKCTPFALPPKEKD